jgi:signal peptidase
MKKIFLRTTDIIMAAMVLVALAIVIPNLYGVKTLAVLSNSLEPNIKMGSMVFVTPTKPAEIEIGDFISYTINVEKLVTSRVTKIDVINKLFSVEDDLSGASEAMPVPFDSIIGVVKFSMPIMGYLLGYVLTSQGKIVVITGVLALIIIMALLGGQEPGPKKTEKHNKKYSRPMSIKPLGPSPAINKKKTYSRDYRYESKYYSGERSKVKNKISYD